MEDQQRRIILETMETVLDLGLRSVRQALGKEEPQPGAVRRCGRKRKSLVDLCQELLTDEQCPIHIDEMVVLLKQRYGRVNRSGFTVQRTGQKSQIRSTFSQGISCHI